MKACACLVVLAAAWIAACGSSSSGGAGVDGGTSSGGDGGGGDGGGGDAASNGDASCGAGCCHGKDDCTAPAYCQAVEDPSCGDQVAQECNADADCADGGADRICVSGPCSSRVCGPKCTKDADCGSATLVCASTGHCVAKACSGDADCPTNYACTGGTCSRKACTTDAQCSGACINGFCSRALGQCQLPAG